MKEIIKRNLKELNERYNYLLEEYEKDGYSYQEDQINEVRSQIRILEKVLEESGDSDE